MTTIRKPTKQQLAARVERLEFHLRRVLDILDSEGHGTAIAQYAQKALDNEPRTLCVDLQKTPLRLIVTDSDGDEAFEKEILMTVAEMINGVIEAQGDKPVEFGEVQYIDPKEIGR